jgi:hypothetical protein
MPRVLWLRTNSGRVQVHVLGILLPRTALYILHEVPNEVHELGTNRAWHGV